VINLISKNFKKNAPNFFLALGEVALVRVGVTMACTECKRRNYTTEKNKKNDSGRIEMKKYCRWCHTHTLHKETR
jgi:large subunit ribosomal protein L33